MAYVVQRDEIADHSHWWWFALVSLALHALLILEWPDVEVDHLGGLHSSPIAVTLLANSQQTQHPMGQQSSSKRDEGLTTERRRAQEMPTYPSTSGTPNLIASAKPGDYRAVEGPSVDIQPNIQKAQHTPIADRSKERIEQVTASSAPSSLTLIEQRLLSEIKIEFSRYFRYPPRALRKQLEGMVVLSFRIDGTGNIQGVVVAQSSGHGILDRAAITSLNRITPLSGIPKSGVSFELPIIYKIHNG